MNKKYNDIISFDTDKKDLDTARVIKKFAILGVSAIALLIIIALIVNAFLNSKVDLTLSSLDVDQGIISPEFDRDIYSYSLETNADSIFFTCKTTSKKATAIGCGSTIRLDDNEKNVNITVKYKKNKKVYKFQVVKNSKFNINVEGNSDDFTDKDITLVVSATSLEGIPLHNEAYSFDDGETWQKDNKKTFSKNQTVKIRVRDSEENISASENVRITKIDKTVPEVKLSVKGKKLTATVNPNKTPSGYTYNWYYNGEKIENASKVNYTAKKSGNYKVEVVTGLGKKAMSEEVNVSSGVTYTISYNANGGSGAPSDQVKAKDEDLTITSKQPTRNGYIFEGWATSKTGNVKYSAGSVYSRNKSIILYAIWKKSDKKETYTISYNGTGGGNVPANQTKEKNESITISNTIPTKANHDFLGWSTTNGGGVEYSPGSTYNKNESVTLYAVWQKMKTITVKYIGNGAQVNQSSITNSGTNVFTMPGIIRSGYEIIGWSTSATATSATYKVGQKATFSDSMTLYAITAKSIKATFNKNTANSISKTTESCKLYNIATLCAVTTPNITPRSGRKALGWATSANAQKATFGQNTKIAISTNTTLYAITK